MKTQNKTVLIVDGNEQTRERLALYLKESHYDVLFADSGEQMLQLAKQEACNLICLNPQLPDMTGLQVVQHIQGDSELQNIPVLILSYHNAVEMTEQCLQAKAEEYIREPFEAHFFRMRVDACFQKKTLHNQLRQYEEDLENAEKLADISLIITPIVLELAEEKDFAQLLKKILIEAKAVCKADGGTLYLREKDRLKFSLLLNDSLSLEINNLHLVHPDEGETAFPSFCLYKGDSSNIPDTRYIATTAAVFEQTINIEDIYGTEVANAAAFVNRHTINIPDIDAEERFDFAGGKTFDQTYHYHTRSLLTTPLKNYCGEVIGVLQLVNAQDPTTGEVIPFDPYMEQVVETLAAQISVVLNTRLLVEGQSALLRFEKELQIGQQIQASFLPDSLPQIPGWEIAACFHPAREVAGDFYDVFPTADERQICFVLADVCDKGVGAALFMALIRTLIRAFTKYNPPQQVVLAGNRAIPIELTNNYILQNQIQTSMFATLFAGVLDPQTGLVRYVNCGHLPPYILGTNGIKTKLKPTGPIVGAFPGIEYHVHEYVLEPGDVLFLFTDGLSEARNAEGEFFTNERIVSLLEQPITSAEELLEQAKQDVYAHIGKADQFDDITLLVIRRTPDNGNPG